MSLLWPLPSPAVPATPQDLLVPVFEDGELLKEYSFGEVRAPTGQTETAAKGQRSTLPLSSVVKGRVCGWFEDEAVSAGGTPTKASPAHSLDRFNL